MASLKKVVPAKSKRTKKSGFILFLMTLPIITGIIIFAYIPLFGWSYAFVDYRPGFSFFDMNFVGFKWFRLIANNPVLQSQMVRVMKNTLGINLLYMGTMFLPMIFAIFLSEIRSNHYRKVVQTITTIPHFISWVLVYAAFFAILSTDGLLNSLQLRYGIINTPVNHLANPSHMWLKMLFYHHWKNIGWSAILYIATISSIDPELYQAADIDGAGCFSKMYYVTVPHLLPTFFVLLLLRIGNMLNHGMDQYLVFSNALTKDHIEVLDLYVYNNGLKKGQISYATAVGMAKSLISLFLLFSGNSFSKFIRGEAIF